MKAIVADDEPHLVTHLCARLTALWPELSIVGTAGNGPDALHLIDTLLPDIAFLDIRMPGFSGIEVACRRSHACRVVFVTAYDHYAVNAFEQEAVDYVLKPVGDERLGKTLARLRNPPASAVDRDGLMRLLRTIAAETPVPRREPLRWIRAQQGASIRLVGVDEVCYFQATDKYTAVVTRDAELLIRTPLKELVAQLDAEQFWQVHRGTVVNLKQVLSAKPDALGRLRLELRDRPDGVMVSRSYAHLFRQM